MFRSPGSSPSVVGLPIGLWTREERHHALAATLGIAVN
jgi:hypothetical protein